MSIKIAKSAASSGYVVLVADDDRHILEVCRDVSEGMGLQVHVAESAKQALQLAEQVSVDLVLADLRLPDSDGITLLRRLKEAHPTIEVILMTGYGTVETAVEAVKQGAYDYLAKPFHVDDLRAKLQNVLTQIELTRENRVLREQVRGMPGFGGLLGNSPKMKRVFRLIQKVSQSRCSVLITGESGTGKELVARSIHFQSAQKDKPFVPVDCAGLVPTLVETELFGHVKGAFTGATRSKQGLMELAHGGILFFDEVAELPTDMQAKLLRALQEREIRPVGGTRQIPIDVRVLAATNRDLEQTVREGHFRQDLYYRLNVVTIRLPSLRERKSDIPLLTNCFLENLDEESRKIHSVSEEAMSRLMSYDWPGNVRELENVVQRAVALGAGSVFHTVDLPSNFNNSAAGPGAFSPRQEGIVPLRALEKRAIRCAVQEVGGDKLLAARLLGIGKTTLYRKLKEYEIETEVKPYP